MRATRSERQDRCAVRAGWRCCGNPLSPGPLVHREVPAGRDERLLAVPAAPPLPETGPRQGQAVTGLTIGLAGRSRARRSTTLGCRSAPSLHFPLTAVRSSQP